MRKLLLTVGFLALALGLLWIGQGTGVVAWPKTSFMINEIQWALYGAALAAIGLIFIWLTSALWFFETVESISEADHQVDGPQSLYSPRSAYGPAPTKEQS